MVADAPTDFLGDVRLHHLGAPPTVINLDQTEHDVVQQAGEDRFFFLALFQSVGRALKDVRGRRETQLEEVDERRLVRHRVEGLQRAYAAAHPAWTEDRSGAFSDGQLV